MKNIVICLKYEYTGVVYNFRPAAFITTMAREVARYNTMQQNAQTLNINMNNTILHRAKTEILRCVELLIEKMQIEMSDLLVEVSMIVVNVSKVLEKYV